MATIDSLADQERWQAVDRVLELLSRLSKPIQCDARLTELAVHLGLSADAVRAQFEALPVRARERYRSARGGQETRGTQPAAARESSSSQAAGPRPQRHAATQVRAWRELVGAVLVDGLLVDQLAELVADSRHACDHEALALLAGELVELSANTGRLPELDEIFGALGMHPAIDLVVPLIEQAKLAESPTALFDGARAHLERSLSERTRSEQIAELARLSPTEHNERLAQLHSELRREKFANTQQEHDAPARN
jgi:hypothetical protein